MRSGKSLPYLFLSLAVVGSLLLFAENAMASGPQERALYTFAGKSHGGGPFEMDGLIADQSGNLYGTARGGGQGGGGVVFELTPPSVAGGRWTETVLYSFPYGGDGGFPMGGLTFDAAGNLYGTAAYGGKTGNGSVFELSPPAIPGGTWTETTLHHFAGGSDGEVPVSGVVLDSSGNVYGTAYYGGAANAGAIFELSPPAVLGGAWTETLLHTFTESHGTYAGGAHPNGGLLLNPEGALLGTADGGGDANSYGVVFKLVPPAAGQTIWREEVLYNFTGGSDGGDPFGDLALVSDGSFYGVATVGGFNGYGTIYQMTPPTVLGGSWTETTAYTFTGGSNDAYPLSVLFHSGNLYGTTGGFDGAYGEVFELTLQSGVWVETIIHDFANTDGNYPAARLTFNSNKLYGTTLLGGSYQQGVFFEVIP
jgi:uncharacterized repeat protein (TIGR03803 family)